MEKIKEVAVQSGLQDIEASDIVSNFKDIQEGLDVLNQEYDAFCAKGFENIDAEKTKEARKLRLKYKNLRVENDKIHKKVKEKSLSITRAIDGVRNVFKHDIVNIEESLTKIEKHFELEEQRKKDELQAKRVQEIIDYIDESSVVDFTSMSDDMWANFVDSQKKTYLEKIEQEKKLKEEQEAERLRLKEVEEENKRLKAEAEQKEKELNEIKLKELEEIKKEKEQQEALRKETEAKKFDDFLVSLGLTRADLTGDEYKLINSNEGVMIYKKLGVFNK